MVATSGGETYIEALQAAAEVIRGNKYRERVDEYIASISGVDTGVKFFRRFDTLAISIRKII